jgi:hypothetical protein
MITSISLPGTPINEADYQCLSHSWIDREHADRALLRRVMSAEGAEIAGQKQGGADYNGILFPYVWPGELHVREYRLRRDNPEAQYDGKGVLKGHARKYLSPPGRGNILYFVPGTPPEWLKNIDIPIIITEGEKKAIALFRLAYYALSDSSEQARFLPVALSGVWNWRGTIGKETGPTGKRIDVKGIIPDFNRLQWTDRKVILAFDSDTNTNEKVRAARHDLGKHLLLDRGARVIIVNIPGTAEHKIGIDDLLATDGPEKTLKIIDRGKEVKFQEKTDLSRIIEDAEFFHTQEGRSYATFNINEHTETWAVRSQGFRGWLVRRYYNEKGKPLSTQALQESVNLCDARAQYDGAVCEVGIRLIGTGSSVFLDLGNDLWQAVEIKPTGWRVVSDHPDSVRFRRARGMSSLPVPISGDIRTLRRFINAGDEQSGDDANWILMLAWLVAALSPSGPYPILILQGEQGTGKSTVARVLRQLVDPSTAALRTVPRDERDLMIAANNSWVLSLDNLSALPHWLSDALCRLSTGGGFATRELHTDNEEILFNATRPIMLNGIDDIASNADLADRAVIVTLGHVSEDQRIPEKLFWQDFLESQASILGALLDIVSAALRNLETVNVPRLPRMADFATWVCAACLGGHPKPASRGHLKTGQLQAANQDMFVLT